jgi:hypothetical protein
MPSWPESEQEVAEAGGLVVGVVAGGQGGDVDGFRVLHDYELIALGLTGEAVAFAADGEDVFGGLGLFFEFSGGARRCGRRRCGG